MAKPYFTAQDTNGAPSDPGVFPYTRGIDASQYRRRLWSMRQFSGFSTPEETNRRLHFLLKHGETGLSIAFDLPTLMGLDSDHPQSEGEVGKGGVSVCTLDDFRALLKNVPLEKISISMTINAPAAVLMGMLVLLSDERGISRRRISGTIQNDILKEFIAQNEFVFPPRPSLRLAVDVIEYCAKEIPRFYPVSISGYHIREAGSSALQELVFTLADGFTYIEEMLKRGHAIDDFAPRLSFFFNSHNDFFEELAKFRAARRIWAKRLKERWDAKKETSLWLKFHAQTAGCTLTAQEPRNNLVRCTLQALAAVMGGAHSLHVNGFDEALALPTEEAARLALRTQQIIAHESGVARVADPFGGSYALEAATDALEEKANELFKSIDEMGGVVAGIENGFFVRAIQEESAAYEKSINLKERRIVGVNAFVSKTPHREKILKLHPASEKKRRATLQGFRRRRNSEKLASALQELENKARTQTNLMPPIMEALKNQATLGEIMSSLQRAFGSYS